MDGFGMVCLHHRQLLSLVCLFADSYNHKIKTLDPTTGEVKTLIGTGQPGMRMARFEAACLSEGLWLKATGLHCRHQ
jgi:hypothetical protein